MDTATQTVETPFKRVKNDGYDGDCLDGKPLRGAIEIKWPDGTVTSHKVIRRDNYHAYIKLTWHGVRLDLLLREIPKILVRRKVESKP